MRAILIDDERPSLELLRIVLEKRDEIEIIGAYSNPVEAWLEIEQKLPDVIFVDIEMPKMSGLELAARVNRLPQSVSVVFVTAYSHYALDAFGLNVIHYLTKPVDDEEITECFERVYQKRPELRSLRSWTIQLFSGLTLYCEDERKAAHWPTAKSRELISYLILNKHKKNSKWDIIEALWPGEGRKKMESNLHSTVNRCRHALKMVGGENIILRERHYYYIDWTRFHCDYWTFEKDLQEFEKGNSARLASANRIVDLYTGPLFGAEDYVWASNQVDLARSAYIQALRAVADDLLKDGKEIRAESYLLRLLEADSCDEPACEALMMIYKKRRDKASFIACYKQLEHCLLTELELTPSAGIIKLYCDYISEDG